MPVRFERDEGVVTLTLDWPERRNAIGPAEATELTDAINSLDPSTVDVLILAGNGAFCAGGDLPSISAAVEGQSPQHVAELIYGQFQGMVRALQNTLFPTIAALDGPAIGLGADLALACDMRFVGAKGWLQQGWARIGLVSGTAGVIMMQQIAPGETWRFLVEQPRLDGADCARLGFAEQADGTAIDAARARAVALMKMPRPAVRGYVEILRRSVRISDVDFEACARLQGSLLTSESFRRFAQGISTANPDR